jgi:hypothetical protein
MSLFINSNSTIGILYFVESSILFVNTAYFFAHQLKQAGSLKQMFVNKFVVLTSAGSSLYVLFTLMDAIGFSTLPNSLAVGAIASISYLVTISCHVSLVYLRSKAIFLSGAYINVLLFSVLGVVVCFALSGLVYIIYFITLSGASFIIAGGFGLTGGVFLSVVEVLSTFAFAKKISEVQKDLFKDTLKSITIQVHEKQTYVIARRGFALCSVACLALAFIWSGYGWLWWATQNGITNIQTFHWIFWVASCLITTIMILWIWMKIEVDSMKATEAASKVSSKNNVSMV